MKTEINETEMSKDEIIATLRRDLDQAAQEWLTEYNRRRNTEKTLEACLALIKHLQNA